jgi:methyl-accepting chemotaxis protein
MKITFINKELEKMLKASGVITSRDSCIGMPCNRTGKSICGPENCGVKLLEKGISESYYKYKGNNYMLNATAITDENHKRVGFVEMFHKVNALFEANEYSAEQIARIDSNLIKLAQGNFDLDFTVDEGSSNTDAMRVQFENISDNLRKVTNSVSLMVSNVEELCAAAIEGNLEKRADESQHSGEFKLVVAGLNKTLDAAVAPIKVALNFINKMAKGEFTEPIENSFKGDYAVLIDSINSVRGSMALLYTETMNLLAAVSEGDISARGKNDNLRGLYADFIVAINKTLDSILIPLDQAIVIMEKMSRNDLEDCMSSGYKGKLGEFAESINMVRERLLSILDIFVNTSRGDLTMIEKFKNIGLRSEHDKMLPASIGMMQCIIDLTKEVNQLADKVARGDLSTRGNSDRFEGEYKNAIDGINRLMDAVARPMSKASEVLHEWSSGNLSKSFDGEYSGIFADIQKSFTNTSHAFCEILQNMAVSADQVASGSQQIASGSQSLSQGATEQASSLEELTASITEVASQTRDNANSASSAKSLSDKVQEEAISGNAQMKQMLDAMKEISDASSNIAKIIKVIEDIAFQTNLLALNAAVEAARAGQAGKGFAVVAEEVRNLAARSASAANDTTELIESTLKKVSSGTSIAGKTANALDKIVGGVEKFASIMREISDSSNQQATSIAQIDKALAQVSSVVQTNSATAEESAAASEELSSQAQLLKQMVGNFKSNQDETPAAEKPLAPAVQPKSTVKKAAIILNDKEKNKYGEF